MQRNGRHAVATRVETSEASARHTALAVAQKRLSQAVKEEVGAAWWRRAPVLLSGAPRSRA
jgi:hypothetical protein